MSELKLGKSNTISDKSHNVIFTPIDVLDQPA